MISILVIEDETAIRENLLDLLQAEGFDAVGVGDGRVGLERILAKPPALVLCDVALPGLDGLSVLRALRANPAYASIPFILLTGRADRADMRAGMNLGADDYITKPFARTELLEAISTRLRRSAVGAKPAPSASRIIRATPARGDAVHGSVRLAKGDIFDRYRIESSIGEGGMGQVYRALDTKLGREVALKVLGMGSTANPAEWQEASARLLVEAQAAATLCHPNVVTIFDVGEVEGIPFLAMELIAGRTLGVAARDAGWAQILAWLGCVTEALAAAHDAGMVHRDVKPDNVMVRDDGRVCVLDFGIVRRDAGIPLTGAGMVIGTLAYMAPEQLQSGAQIDGRADQFSWGVTAYELLAGRSPWPAGNNPVRMINAILDLTPAPLGPLVPGLPEEAVSIITRTLEKIPTARFPSMVALLAALDPILANVVVAPLQPVTSDVGGAASPDPGASEAAFAPTIPLALAESKSNPVETSLASPDAKEIVPVASGSKKLGSPRIVWAVICALAIGVAVLAIRAMFAP